MGANRPATYLTIAPKTDFWRVTHYGFIRHSGHFFYATIAGDCVAEVTDRTHNRTKLVKTWSFVHCALL